MIKSRYRLHTNKISIDSHPIYIKEKLKMLDQDQFGYDAFGLKNNTNRKIKNKTVNVNYPTITKLFLSLNNFFSIKGNNIIPKIIVIP